MTRITLILCALVALGAGAVCFAQGAPSGVPGAGAAGAVGTAEAADETALLIGDAATTAGGAPAVRSTIGYFLRMVLVLALVIAALYLALRFIKRTARPSGGDAEAIKLLATKALGAGKALHVVSLGAQAFLVGASESSISLIAELSDKEYVDSLELAAATAPRAKRAAFGDLLGSMLSGGGKRPRSGRGSDFLAGQRDRLRKL